MDARKVEELATALWRGEMTQDKFVRETGAYWRRLAADVYRRWRKKLPPSVELEDVEQTFLMQVLDALPRWDPSTGLSIGKFVSWSATKRTQREIHKMRGARIHGNEGKNAGRPETTFSKYVARRSRGEAKDGRPSELDPCDLVPLHATQDVEAAVREVLDDALFDATDVREAFVMLALRESAGDPDEASVRLFESFSARVECGLRDVEQTRRLVLRTVERALSEAMDAA